jgi:PKD repeat protein
VFLEQVMPAIRGATTQESATDALSARADHEVRVDYYDDWNANMYDSLYRYWDGLGWTQRGTPCQNQAGVLAGFLRAAGIPASIFVVDWRDAYDDHSVLVWFDNQWMAARSYQGGESGNPAYQYYPFNNGHTPANLLKDWDYLGSYMESIGTVVITADEHWDYEQWQEKAPGGSCTLGESKDGKECYLGGMVGTRWRPNDHKIKEARDYKWEPIRPLELAIKYPYVETLNTVLWRGEPWLPEGWPDAFELPDPYPGGDLGENWPIEPVAQDCPPGYLEPCPYQTLGAAAALPADDSTAREALPAQYDALLADLFSHRGVDEDGDGRYEAITVDVTLDISQPDVYRVEGSLYDVNGTFVSYATWTGSDALAHLSFDLQQSSPPYTLEELRLFDKRDALLDSRYHEAHAMSLDGPTDQGAIHVNAPKRGPGGIAPLGEGITPTLGFTHQGIDLDGDGLYDQLAVDVQVQVSQTGSYRVDGWLEEPDGSLMAYTISDPTVLKQGLKTLSLRFDGRAINGQAKDGPYRLIALRILNGNGGYDVLDQVDVTGLALDYDAADFDKETEVALLFGDDMESGTGNWNWMSPWSQDSKSWPSPTNLWRARSSGIQSGFLRTIALNLSDYTRPFLRFNTTYRLETTNDVGHVQVSANGVDWTQVAAYNNDTDRWSTTWLDISEFGEIPNLFVRFNASSQNNLLWYIDDVRVNAWPAVTAAYFSYTPTEVVADEPITFVARYDSIDRTLPMTYTWDFGDGSPPIVTPYRKINHRFPESKEYDVQLTIANPYDDVQLTLTVGAGDPVTSASFDFNPAEPEVLTSIQFTAGHSPSDATTPVTYRWDFGDNTTVETTAQNVAHSYPTGGFYQVKLTAFNGYGIATHDEVVETKEGLAGVSFTYQPGSPLDGDLVTFDASFEPDTASQPINYTWDFGDGSVPIITTIPNITHVFTGVGTHTIEVTAFNGYGSPATHSETISITGRPISDASFRMAQTQSHAEYETTFHASVTPSHATRPVTYIWNFGDGNTHTATNSSATHEFTPPSVPYTYTVQLTAVNGWGAPVTVVGSVRLPFDDDADGLSNSEEFAIGTDPQNPDTDADFSWDGDEWNGYIFVGYPPHPDYDKRVKTNPLDADTDDDGLLDGKERDLSTHPGDSDTDDDGLLDGEEPGIAGTPSPLNPDSDDDGLLDGEEVKMSATDPLEADSDGDGIWDRIEVDEDNDPDNSLDPAKHPDTDNDGTRDAWDLDSDGDTISDADEWSTGSDDLLVGCDDVAEPICTDNNVDGDRLDNYRDPNAENDCAPDAFEFDIDGDGLPDDSDADGMPNWLDTSLCVYMPSLFSQNH